MRFDIFENARRDHLRCCGLVDIEMRTEPDLGARIRFGIFQLDVANQRLLKGATNPVELPLAAFLALKALVERPGELVSRRELQQIIFSEGAALSVDDELSTAVENARLALDDSETKPRFIETLLKGTSMIGICQGRNGGRHFRAATSWVRPLIR